MILKRFIGSVFVAAIVLGLLPCVAHATAPKLETKIVFDATSSKGYGRHWSLDATSVAPVNAKARLMRRQPTDGTWVGYAGRTVTISRVLGSTHRVDTLTRTTDGNGYVTVAMPVPARYAVDYSGSQDSMPSSKTQKRVDYVGMTRTTSVTKVPVDAVTTRVTFITDYRYNPHVAEKCGGVHLETILGTRDSLSGATTWIRPKQSDVFEWRYFGQGRSEVSFLVPSTETDRLRFVSSVKYPGGQAFVSSGPADQPSWQPVPVTTGLWLPRAGSTPTSGSYVYLQSDPGDYVGQGQEYLYTRSNAQFTMSPGSRGFVLNLDAGIAHWWGGIFTLPNDGKGLRPGYYPDMRNYANYADPSKGTLYWSGNGRANNTSTGWVIVDSVTYTRGVLTGLDARFEQHGEGRAAALRGAIHWVSDNPPLPPGPLNPIPGDLWKPAPGSVPTSGTFVYLKSDTGDYIGEGREYLYTPSDSVITVSEGSGDLRVTVGDGRYSWWRGDFSVPIAEDQLLPGHYPYLSRVPFHDPAQGGLEWSGMGNGSSNITGWFVVDNATYADGVLKAIDLRFEQHSEGGAPALRGLIRWKAEE